MRQAQPPPLFTVRLKLTAVLLTVMLVLLASIVAVGRYIVQPYLMEREKIQVLDALTHGKQALQLENSHVVSVARDLIKSLRLGDPTFHSLLTDFTTQNETQDVRATLDAAMLLDANGKVLSGHAHFSRQLSSQDTPQRFSPSLHVAALEQAMADTDCLQGLLVSSEGPMLAAVCRVPRESQTAHDDLPAARFFVAANRVDADIMARLSAQTGLNLEILPLSSATPTTPHQLEQVETVSTEKEARGQILLADPLGAPSYLLSGTLQQRALEKGNQAMRLGIMFILSTGIILVSVLWLLIDHIMLAPVRALSKHISRVSQSKDLSIRLSPGGRDEMARLTLAFDQMLGELDLSRRQLGRRSFGQGMAGMAAGLLHNVRNALSPLVARLHLLRERLGNPLISQAAQAATELAQPDAAQSSDDNRQADLKRFLALVLPEIDRGAKSCQEELDELINLAAKTESILSSQDLASRSWLIKEKAHLSDICIEALELIDKSRLRGVDIELDHQLDSFGDVEADPLNLQQVLANLLLNAAESITSQRSTGLIHIFTRKASLPAQDSSQQEQEAIELVVQDNGQGLSHEQISHLFEQGYSTKKRTGSGLGLHWCANAVAAMGGALMAESEGPGLGARMIIRLKKGTQ